jgi:osmotically-inducible protein OsmY
MSTALMSDLELQWAVMEELKWEPRVNPAHIGVSVKNGVVTLTGHVSSYAEKYAAERAAKRVRGVRAVANEIDVKLPGSSRITDEDIATAAVNALRSNVAVPADRVKVTVNKGWVTLEGEVEWQYQRIAAENAVRYLPGVTGVTNLIVVKPRAAPTDLKAKIEEALKRAAELDASRITVEVDGGKVILRGTVRSWPRRRRPSGRPGRRRASTRSRTSSPSSRGDGAAGGGPRHEVPPAGRSESAESRRSRVGRPGGVSGACRAGHGRRDRGREATIAGRGARPVAVTGSGDGRCRT